MVLLAGLVALAALLTALTWLLGLLARCLSLTTLLAWFLVLATLVLLRVLLVLVRVVHSGTHFLIIEIKRYPHMAIERGNANCFFLCLLGTYFADAIGVHKNGWNGPVQIALIHDGEA